MRGGGAAGEGGASLVEVVVHLLLVALLAHGCWTLLVRARAAGAALVARSEVLETERTGAHVLGWELRAGVPGRDWALAGARTVELRAFRGVGEVCEPLAPGEALVRYRGVRLPEPAKDSLLLLGADGEWRAVKLSARAVEAAGCPASPGERAERWRWEPALGGALFARVFERGSYHLEDRAVRYRTGQGGRQPLTPERLAQGALELGPGRLDLVLELEVGPGLLRRTRRSLLSPELTR